MYYLFTLFTQLKPYQCKVCGQRFGHQSNLRIHKRTHSDDRPFKCPHPDCDRGLLLCIISLLIYYILIFTKTFKPGFPKLFKMALFNKIKKSMAPSTRLLKKLY